MKIKSIKCLVFLIVLGLSAFGDEREKDQLPLDAQILLEKLENYGKSVRETHELAIQNRRNDIAKSLREILNRELKQGNLEKANLVDASIKDLNAAPAKDSKPNEPGKVQLPLDAKMLLKELNSYRKSNHEEAEIKINNTRKAVARSLRKILNRELKQGNLGKANLVNASIENLKIAPDRAARPFRNPEQLVYKNNETKRTIGNETSSYVFEVTSVGETAKIIVEANHRKFPSKGDIYLKSPGRAEEIKIGMWSGSADNPMEVEVPGGIKRDGKYTITFKNRGKINGFRTESVELRLK